MIDFRNPPPISRSAQGGLLLAFIALFTAISGGLGSRWDWWSFGIGFTVLKWGVFIAIAALLLSLWGIVATRRGGYRGRLSALLGLIISLPIILTPIMWINKARAAPPIHDISTDTLDPPQFQAILPLRKDAPNSAQYEGADVAAQQRKAYPDIQPVAVKVPPPSAFDAALYVAHDLGWHIVAQDPAQGRIEATDTTFWFGFTDDIVIRIKATDSGSRVDIRSDSRVGRSDVGTNADRIRKFTRAFLRRVS